MSIHIMIISTMHNRLHHSTGRFYLNLFIYSIFIIWMLSEVNTRIICESKYCDIDQGVGQAQDLEGNGRVILLVSWVDLTH